MTTMFDTDTDTDTDTYTVVRHYYRGTRRTLKTGLTLKEAKDYCNDPETSSATATSKRNVAHTAKHGPWFDAFVRE